MEWDARAPEASSRLARLASTLLLLPLPLVLLVLPLMTRAAAAQTTPPVATDFDVVQVDLNGQLFNRVLPFDVPFIFTGPVPQGVASLKVYCRKLGVDKHSRKPSLVAPEALENNDGSCWNGEPLKWRNTIDPTAPNPQFRVLAPPLEAENFYQFKFTFEKKVTPEEAEAFAQKVQEIVDPILWGDPRTGASLPLVSEQLTDRELEAIRKQLVEALKQATGADVIPEGNLFSDSTPTATVRNEFNRLLRPVRNAQSQIDSTAETYTDAVSNLNALLQELRGIAALPALRDALAARGTADPTAQDRAAAITAALAVADAPVLLQRDRESPASLTAFLEKSTAYFADAAAKVARLRALLGKLTAPDGSPQPFVKPLAGGGQLAPGDVSKLAAMAQDQGMAGTLDRTMKGVAWSVLPNLQSALDRRAQAVAAAAAAYKTQIRDMIVVAGSTTGSFQTQSSNYISADTGVACAPQLSSCSTYAGTNLYFRPVNKAAPLGQFGPFFSKASLSRRVALTLGLTLQGVGDGKTRDDLFGNQSLVLGLGARMTNSVRLTAGGLVFKERSPNPLSTDTKLTTTYFVSVSFDIDVVPALKGLGGLFKP
jgi:hypothetical protein